MNPCQSSVNSSHRCSLDSFGLFMSSCILSDSYTTYSSETKLYLNKNKTNSMKIVCFLK